jgi:spore maturation protein B
MVCKTYNERKAVFIKKMNNTIRSAEILCVGTELLKASGAADIFAEIFGGALGVAGIPKELASFLFVRPVSGSAAITMMRNVFENCGPDSYEGFLASVIMGSGDTLIYIIGVYYSSVGIKKTGYSLFAAVLASVFSVLFCSAICKIMFFS